MWVHCGVWKTLNCCLALVTQAQARPQHQPHTHTHTHTNTHWHAHTHSVTRTHTEPHTRKNTHVIQSYWNESQYEPRRPFIGTQASKSYTWQYPRKRSTKIIVLSFNMFFLLGSEQKISSDQFLQNELQEIRNLIEQSKIKNDRTKSNLESLRSKLKEFNEILNQNREHWKC